MLDDLRIKSKESVILYDIFKGDNNSVADFICRLWLITSEQGIKRDIPVL